MIDRIDAVITALRAAGVRADRGNPQGLHTVIESPIAAVSVERSGETETVLKVWILGPAAQGGMACEDLAQTVAGLLRQDNARCEVGACRFDEDMGLFAVEVLAAWQALLETQVTVGQEPLAYVTDFSAVQTRRVEQVTDAETGESALVNEAQGWTVTIRELLPMDQIPAVEPMDGFTLTVTREGWVETYPQCYWSSITLQETEAGLIRQRTAITWAERTVQA